MDDMSKMAEALKGGIDANSTDAPQMSIDPKTSAVSVVGDPNKIANEDGVRPYKIIFTYPEEALSDDDKEKMVKSEMADDEYEAEVTYEGKRVKPIHRTKIAMTVGEIFNAMGLFTIDGSYDSATIGTESARIFLEHVDEIAEAAKLVLGIPDSQIEYIRSDCLVEFFVNLLHNEPNIIKEAAGFLDVPSRQRLAKLVMEATKQQNTQQN